MRGTDLVVPFRGEESGEHVLSGSPRGEALDLVVYGDYECPFTPRGLQAIEEVRGQFGDLPIRVSYRHFPLFLYHPNAFEAAMATEAAHEQGRFQELHRLLLANFRRLSPGRIRELAREAGLDMARFELAMASARVKQRVRDDVRSGIESGVVLTPALFIANRLFTPPVQAGALSNTLLRLSQRKAA